jgi:hypothetical protein
MTLPQAFPGPRTGRDLGMAAAVDYVTGGRLPET